MSYQLEFEVHALKEWQKLDSTIRTQLKKRLKVVCENPHIPAAKLSQLPNCYKIKLRSSGYRLVYQVFDDRILVLVLAIGKREKKAAYETASMRFQ